MYQLHATNLSRYGYGKGWQVNALTEGTASECTFYGVNKEYALRQARAIIQTQGRLPHEPYKGADAIFKGFKLEGAK